MTDGLSKVNLRPANREDLDQFEHYRPTVEATVAELDGKLIAVGGFAFLQGMVFLFLELKPEARRFKVTMHRMALAMIEKAKRRGFKFVYAQTDGTEPTAPRWLARLGFIEIGIGLYRWQA